MRTATEKMTEPAAGELLCPIRHMLSVLGGKWKLPIICMLSGGMPLRNSAIKRKLGDISNVMLAQSLKELETSGIVRRQQYNEVPPRVEYSLTDKGKDILPVLRPMVAWAASDIQQETPCIPNCEKCSLTR